MRKEKHEVWRKSFPHFKVQWWDADGRVLAWHDIQETFSTAKEADEHGKTLGKSYRIMKVERDGRAPLED